MTPITIDRLSSELCTLSQSVSFFELQSLLLGLGPLFLRGSVWQIRLNPLKKIGPYITIVVQLHVDNSVMQPVLQAALL